MIDNDIILLPVGLNNLCNIYPSFNLPDTYKNDTSLTCVEQRQYFILYLHHLIKVLSYRMVNGIFLFHFLADVKLIAITFRQTEKGVKAFGGIAFG